VLIVGSPPQTIILEPVQHAAWRQRTDGAFDEVIGVQLSIEGL
jgi:hypothetical protein